MDKRFPLKFSDKGGFRDQVDYIQHDKDGKSWFVLKSGKMEEQDCYDLKTCYRFVKDGCWEIIK